MAAGLPQHDSRNFPSFQSMSGESRPVLEERQVVNVADVHDVAAIVVEIAVIATNVVTVLGRAKIAGRRTQSMGPGVVEDDHRVAAEPLLERSLQAVVIGSE